MMGAWDINGPGREAGASEVGKPQALFEAATEPSWQPGHKRPTFEKWQGPHSLKGRAWAGAGGEAEAGDGSARLTWPAPASKRITIKVYKRQHTALQRKPAAGVVLVWGEGHSLQRQKALHLSP